MDVKPKVKPLCEIQKPVFMRLNCSSNTNTPINKKSHKISYSSRKTSPSHKLPQQNQSEKVNTVVSSQQFVKWKHDLLLESDDEEDEDSFMITPKTAAVRKSTLRGSTSRISHQLAFYVKIDGRKCKVVNAKDVEIPLTCDIICDDILSEL